MHTEPSFSDGSDSVVRLEAWGQMGAATRGDTFSVTILCELNFKLLALFS